MRLRPLLKVEVAPPCCVSAPVLEMAKSVVVAKVAVDEAIAKSVVGTTLLPVVEAENRVNIAYGEEVPIPKLPEAEFQVSEVVPVAPKRTVEDALRPWKSESVVEVAFVFTPKLLMGVQS